MQKVKNICIGSLLIVTFFYIKVSFAQTKHNENYYLVDSLQLSQLPVKEKIIIEQNLAKFHKAANDSLQLNALYAIVKQSRNRQVKKKYNKWVVAFINANKHKISKQLYIQMLFNIGAYHKSIAEYQQAIHTYQQITSLSRITNDKKSEITAYEGIASSYRNDGNFLKANEWYNKALAYYKKIEDKKNIGRLLNVIGFLHENYGMHIKALNLYDQSVTIREEIDDKNGVASVFNNIATVNKKQGKPYIALEYYKKSLAIRQQTKNRSGESLSLNNIGVVYKNLKEYEKALHYYEKSLAIKQKLKNQKGIAHTLNNIGTVYKEQGNYATALKKYNESLKISIDENDERWIAITLFNIGSTCLKVNKIAKAKSSAEQSLKISKKIGHPELIRDASEVLKKVYQQQNNWKKAFETQELYVAMRDSIRNKKTEQAATEQRNSYEAEKREQEIKLLSTQNQVLLKEKEVQKLKLYTNQIITIISILALAIAIGFIIYINNTSKRRKAVNALLQKQDDERQVMLKEIHHRVKNNLQVINSLLRLQAKEFDDKEIVEKFKECQKRVITIAALHEKMYHSDELSHVNLKDYITTIVNDIINTYIIDKEIKTNITIDNIKIGLRTIVPLGLIVNEIVINALKYAFSTTDHGEITITIKQIEKDVYEMLIGDNGVGNTSIENTPGLGSKLIKIFTKQLNGTIEQLHGTGTNFRIVFNSIDVI